MRPFIWSNFWIISACTARVHACTASCVVCFRGSISHESAAEAYPIVEQVLNYYGSDKIYYTVHTYPLWLHRQAYTVAQAAKMVALHAPQSALPSRRR